MLLRVKTVCIFYLDFQTDTDISKIDKIQKKQLVEFTADEGGDFLDGLVGDLGDYDQFETNKEKFNVQTTYEETHYTTALDVNQIPFHVKRRAEEIHKELTNNSKMEDNYHLREERGLKIDSTNDPYEEENLYSYVYREKNK